MKRLEPLKLHEEGVDLYILYRDSCVRWSRSVAGSLCVGNMG